ncbi:MAG: glycolate oxidase subunit GlcE [Alphaproteobacteria bacterium]|nr:glycolate oxidase subunit GlcE [Alphaproteobacteria bacterium]
MSEIMKPTTPEQVAEAVTWAASTATPLEIMGAGSKRKLGAPVVAEHQLHTTALSGIKLYEPEELVMSAGAGTPLGEIEAALKQSNQRLAFEPSDMGPLFGEASEIATIGGAIAANLAGPRRIWSGAARDHFLGFTMANGRGELIKGGGRVVKNVTGFDLCKLLAGSYGTLGVMTEVTFKILPSSEESRTLIISGCTAQSAVKAMNKALAMPFEISGAAYATERALLRIEGPSVSVAYKAEGLAKVLEEFGTVSVVGGSESKQIWTDIRDISAFVKASEKQIWRLSVPPSKGAEVAEQLSNQFSGEFILDWGGALVWLALDPTEDAHAQVVREAADKTGGHATLYRASEAVRQSVPVFHPRAGAVSVVTSRLKGAFDPKGILNPGRMG